jgi:hypothetical protein
MIATLQKLNFGCYRGILDSEGSECIMTAFRVLSISKVSTVCMVKKFMTLKSQEHSNPGVQWLSGLFKPLIFVCCNEDFLVLELSTLSFSSFLKYFVGSWCSRSGVLCHLERRKCSFLQAVLDKLGFSGIQKLGHQGRAYSITSSQRYMNCC